MRKNRKRGSGYNDFAALPRAYFCTKEYRSLSVGARALLVEFALKFKGKNNGNLEMTAEQAHEAGIGSKNTFHRFKTELINTGWVVVTRQGGLCHRCSLYALTYLPIDHTDRQYDSPWRPDTMPLHLWKAVNAERRDQRQKPKTRCRVDQLVPSSAALVTH